MNESIPILASSDRLVAVNKPSGIAVVPAAGAAPETSLRGMLERQLGQRLWVVHRLDRPASGVLVLATSPESHRDLSLAFERRLVRKTYLAFTAGAPPETAGRIDTPLHEARRGKSRPAVPGEAGARDAATGYTLRTSWTRDGARIALVECHPETGRHHQIRVHLRSVGSPILFDQLYGRGAEMPDMDLSPCQRLALHAARLAVPAPDGSMETFEAPLSADLAALLHWLDGEWTPDAG